MANESSVLVRLRLLGGSAFAREAATAGRGLGTIGDHGGRVSKRLSGVNKALGVAGAAMRGVATGGAIAVGAGLAYGVKQSVGFEASMATVSAKLLTTKGNMSLLRDQALDLGSKTQFSASQAAGAMDELAAAGFSTRQIMGTLPGTLSLAAATGADLSQSAAIQTSTLNGFGLAASEAGRVADVLAQTANRSAAGIDDMQESIKYIAPVAKATGQSLTDMMTSVGLMANVGIKGSQAGTTLRTALVRLTKPTDVAQDAMAKLGLKAKDVTGPKGLLPMPQILGKVVKGTQGLSKNTRNAALATIFGREALSGMVALVEKGPKGFARMQGALDNSTGAAKRAADIMRNTVAGSWDNFTGSIETASIKLLSRFNPAMKDTLDLAADVVNKVPSFVGGLTGTAKPPPAAKAKTPLGQAGDRGPAQLAGAAGAGAQVRAKLKPVFDWVQDQAPKLGKALLGAGQDLLEAFRPAMPFISNVLLPLLKGIATGVIGGVVFAFKLAVPIIRIIATALGWIGRAAAPLKPVFFGIGTVIGMIAGGPILGLLGKLKYLGVVFRILAIPLRVAGGLLRAIFGAVVRVGAGFLRALTGAQRFAGTFMSLPGRVLRAALNIVGSIVHTIATLPGKLARTAISAGGRLISGLANGVRSRIGSIVSFMGRVGKSMLDAVVNAIKSAPGAIIGAIKELLPGGKVGDAIADKLGLARGGIVKNPLQIVGERGPELAALPQGTRVHTAHATRRAGAAMAAPEPQNFVANLYLDGKQVHSVVFQRDRQLSEAT